MLTAQGYGPCIYTIGSDGNFHSTHYEYQNPPCHTHTELYRQTILPISTSPSLLKRFTLRVPFLHARISSTMIADHFATKYALVGYSAPCRALSHASIIQSYLSAARLPRRLPDNRLEHAAVALGEAAHGDHEAAHGLVVRGRWRAAPACLKKKHHPHSTHRSRAPRLFAVSAPCAYISTKHT